MSVLDKSFFLRPSIVVAPDLLGKILVRKYNTKFLTGRICEVEAYMHENDEASHASHGKTKRNASLYKSGGHAYIHSIHMQNCLDVVTDYELTPNSVLIRGLVPLEGIEIMKQLRNKKDLIELTSGPGKLCQALSITRVLDGINMTRPSSHLYICSDSFQAKNIKKTKRIGISKAKDKEWRYILKI